TNTSNVKLTGNDVVPSGGVTVNSLLIQGSGLTVTGTSTLTVSGSGASFAPILVSGGSNSINAPVALGVQGISIVNAGGTANFNGRISGSVALNVAGDGATVLNNADGYTGGTLLESGTLTIGNPTGLGTGTLTLIRGTLQSSIATTVTNAVT